MFSLTLAALSDLWGHKVTLVISQAHHQQKQLFLPILPNQSPINKLNKDSLGLDLNKQKVLYASLGTDKSPSYL
jgi:hypothetical protein